MYIGRPRSLVGKEICSYIEVVEISLLYMIIGFCVCVCVFVRAYVYIHTMPEMLVTLTIPFSSPKDSAFLYLSICKYFFRGAVAIYVDA